MPDHAEQNAARPQGERAEGNQGQGEARRQLQEDAARQGRTPAASTARETDALIERGTLPQLDIAGSDASPAIVRQESVARRVSRPERVAEVTSQFKPLEGPVAAESHRASGADLSAMRVRGLDGTETSVSLLLDDPRMGLSSTHRQIIRETAAEVRAHFKGIGGAYQDANWEHTTEEIGHALKIAQKLGMNSTETTKLVLTSLLSDSVKTPQNFFTHHVDGAIGWSAIADRVLKSLPENEREAIKRDVERAILTHQVSPPNFMSDFHARVIREGLKSDLDIAVAGNELTSEERKSLEAVKQKIDKPAEFTEEERALLDRLTADNPELGKLIKESAAIESLRTKMANPTEQQNIVQRDGMSVLNLSATETAYLKRIGLGQVWTPDKKSPSYQLEIAAIAADGGQYGSLPGKFKYTLLAGPDTPFRTRNLAESWASPEKSAESVKSLLREFPQLRDLSTEELTSTQHIMKERIAPAVRSWIDAQPDVVRNADGSVPFFDAALVYPRDLTPAENSELKQLKTNNTPDETARRRIYELEHAGLSQTEAKQFDFARRIVQQTSLIIKEQFQFHEPTRTLVEPGSDTIIERGRARTGARSQSHGSVEIAAGAGYVAERPGGYDVGTTGAARLSPVVHQEQQLTEKDVADLRRRIVEDPATTVDEKTRALSALDLAVHPEHGEARAAVLKAERENDRAAGAEGKAVGAGMVVLTLAAWYSGYRARNTPAVYLTPAHVR